MSERNQKQQYIIEDTRFIFPTNFSADPEKERYEVQNLKPYGNVVIPDEELAMEMLNNGCNVKKTVPRDEDDIPQYYVKVFVKFSDQASRIGRGNPNVFLRNPNGDEVKLDESNLGIIDDVYVLNVDVFLNAYTWNDAGNKSLYVSWMYVTQDVDDDPFASKYSHPRTLETEHPEEDESLPFC